MLTGELRSQVDAIWNAFWSGGISNPMEVLEQITYLLFLRRLDDLHTLEENKSVRLGKPMERRIFPEGADPKKRPYDDLRWSRFKHFEAKEMFEVVNDPVSPFLRTLGGDASTYSHHMKDARFTIPTPALLTKVVDMIDAVPMEDRDTKGDLYEYMLGKIAAAVTDIGGMMSHAAIVCREYGLPAVTGTGNASAKIKTGMRVRVDGNTGTVTILD